MDLQTFNDRLADQFGRDLIGHPHYRLVWSATQTEKRLGEFTDYVPGTNILIRQVVEVREVRKYPYLQPQWVLERLGVASMAMGDDADLMITYEPFWSFGFEPSGHPKEPVWRAIEFLIDANRNPEVLSPKEMADAEAAQYEREDAMMREFIDASVRNDPFHSSVQDGDTILLNQDGKKH